MIKVALDDITRNSVHIVKKKLKFGGTPWFRGKPKKKLVKKMEKIASNRGQKSGECDVAGAKKTLFWEDWIVSGCKCC